MGRGGALLKLTILGQAAGAGSKTAFVVTRGDGTIVWRGEPIILGRKRVKGAPMLNYSHASKKTAPWMRAVEREARVAWAGCDPLDGSLWLDAVFYEWRPSTHFRDLVSGRVLRPDAPAYPCNTATHDVDKMRRAISDSLTNAGVLADDKRIVGGEAWKEFVDDLPPRLDYREPKAVVVVGKMQAQTVADLGLVSPPPDGQAQLL